MRWLRCAQLTTWRRHLLFLSNVAINWVNIYLGILTEMKRYLYIIYLFFCIYFVEEAEFFFYYVEKHREVLVIFRKLNIFWSSFLIINAWWEFYIKTPGNTYHFRYLKGDLFVFLFLELFIFFFEILIDLLIKLNTQSRLVSSIKIIKMGIVSDDGFARYKHKIDRLHF